MGIIQKKLWGKWGAAIFFGIALAFGLECVLTIYQISRGYGQNQESFSLLPLQANDYVVGGEEGNLWVVTGADPWTVFYPEREVGHIRVYFQTPLTEDKTITCFYANNGAFQLLQYKSRYLLQGTREATFTIPYGRWNSYRLSISGNFVLDRFEGVAAVPLRSIQPEQIIGEWNPVRGLVFLFLFCASGILFVNQREDKKEKVRAKGEEGVKRREGKPRVVYLDAVRVLAALMVILVHIVVPMEGFFNLQANKVMYWFFWCIRFVIISCNPLFFMLSGALLLPWREETWQDFVQKRLLKVVLPLLVYGGIYLIFLCASKASFKEWVAAYVVRMLEGRVQMGPHLWMVFELMGMYILVIPFRALLKNCSEQTEKMLAVFILALTGIQSIAYYFSIELVTTTFFGDWTGVFLFGYLMNKEWMRRYDPLWAGGGGIILALGSLLAVCLPNGSRLIFGSSIFVLVIACWIFAAMLHWEKYLQKIKGFLFFCSKYSYSVLLIHWFVLHNIIFIQGLTLSMSKLLIVLAAVSACTLLSFCFSVLIDHTAVALLEQGIRLMAGRIQHCLQRK